MKINRYLAIAFVSIICASCAEKLPLAQEHFDGIEFSAAENSDPATAMTKADVYKTMARADWYYLRFGGTTDKQTKENNKIVKFRLHEYYTPPTGGATTPKWGVYELSTSNAGRLDPVDGSEQLNWQTFNGKHTFHTWSEPEGLTMAADNKTGVFDMTINNHDYERFVGVKVVDKDYANNGVTVGLDYRHLISKIQIDKITIIHNDGSVNEGILGSLLSFYFPNLPVMGNFYTGLEAGGTDPHVEMLPESENKIGQMVNFMKFPYRTWDGSGSWNTSSAVNPFLFSTNYGGTSSITWTPRPFYTLPFKFEDYGKFVVTVTHDREKAPKNYEGNLADIVTNVSEIKAGEVLVLRLVLHDQRGAGGVGVTIKDWDVRDVAVQQVPSHVGVTQNDFVKNSTYTIKANSAATKQYGVEVKDMTLTFDDTFVDHVDAENNKVIKLYSDFNINDTSVGEGYLVVKMPAGYIFDCQGHVFTSVHSYYINTKIYFDSSCCINIPEGCRWTEDVNP